MCVRTLYQKSRRSLFLLCLQISGNFPSEMRYAKRRKGEFGKFRIRERMSLLLLLFLSFGAFLPSRILSTKFFFFFESTLFCSVCVCLRANLLIWLDLHQNGLQKKINLIIHFSSCEITRYDLLPPSFSPLCGLLCCLPGGLHDLLQGERPREVAADLDLSRHESRGGGHLACN